MKTNITTIPAVTKEVTRTVTDTVVVEPAQSVIEITLTRDEAFTLGVILGSRNAHMNAKAPAPALSDTLWNKLYAFLGEHVPEHNLMQAERTPYGRDENCRFNFIREHDYDERPKPTTRIF